MSSSEIARIASHLSQVKRKRPPDSSEITETHQDLSTACISTDVRRVLAKSPPLTDSPGDVITLNLRGAL